MKKLSSKIKPNRSFRITVSGAQAQRVADLLHIEGFRFEPEAFGQGYCYQLTEEPFALGSSLAALFGFVYIQDRSSMLPPLALAPKPGASVLDMCSSPGSKTGFLAQLVGHEGFVLANEFSHSRLFTLRVNMRTCNFYQVGTCSYPGQALPVKDKGWQAIQLDPPCSGWGTVEKNPKVLKLWRQEKTKPLITLQRQLLKQAFTLLAPGGTVVYSTCTTNVEENERQVHFAVNELGFIQEDIPPFAGFVWDENNEAPGSLRVDGQKSNAQGFYIAKLTKPLSAPCPCVEQERGDALWGGREIAPERLQGPSLDPTLLPAGKYALFGDTVRFLPLEALSLPQSFVWQGASLGTFNHGFFQVDPRLRAFMPQDTEAKIVFEDIAAIRALLSGTSLQVSLSSPSASLWWQDLPLGQVSLRNGRIITAFKKI